MISFSYFSFSLVFGFCLGIVFEIINFIKLIFKKNFIVSNFLNFVYAILYGLVVLLTTIKFGNGVFRFVVFLTFAIGTILERKTLGFYLAKLNFWLYNKIRIMLAFAKQNKILKKVLK